MSLIHWWPLNGNITDNGVDNFTLSAIPSFSAAGKIGKCATNTNISAGLAYLSNQTLPLAKDSPISIFTWVYMNDYSTTGANLNGLVSNHNHGHNSDTGSGFGLNLRNNGNSFQVSISTSSTGGRTFSTYCGNTIFSAGEGHHVGFTYNGSRINFYLDGKYDGGLNFTSSYSSNNPIGIFCGSTGYSGYSSSCQLNDVRIYNHALSAKEVKEISKGLVLHYNFEDEYIEPTTNLIEDGNTFSSWSSYGFGSHGSKTILEGSTPNGINKFCRVTDNYTNTSNAAIEMARGVTSTALTNGQQVAFSAYVRGVNNTVGKNCFIHIYNSNDTDTISTTIKSITLTANGQRIKGVFTGNKANTSSTSFSCYVVCEMMQGEQFDFCEPQFEAKDHNTAYVNGTRSTGKVYDNSGYGYNGTNNGIIISNDSISGKFSAQFTQLSDLTGYSYFAGNIAVGGRQNKIKEYRANGLYTIGKLYITDNDLETKKVVEYIPTNKIPNVIGLHMHGNYVLGDNHYLLQAISFEDVIIENKKTSVVNCILQEQLNGEIIGEGQSIDYPELFEASFDRNDFFSAEVQNKEYVCDYAHMNSSIFTSDKKYLYISFKHIGIVKVDYLTKEIIGILGPKTADLLKFPKDFPIFANQHDLHLIDDHTLYFGDNQHLSYAEISFVDDMVANYKTFKCSDTWSIAVMGNVIKASDNILDVCFGKRQPRSATLYSLPIVSEFDLQTGKKLLDLTINDYSLKLSNYMYQVQRGINIYEN